MARDGNPKHSTRSYDPTGEIAAALNAPLPPEREPVKAPPKLPEVMPVRMGGLKPLPRFAKTRKSEAWERRATDDGDD